MSTFAILPDAVWFAAHDIPKAVTESVDAIRRLRDATFTAAKDVMQCGARDGEQVAAARQRLHETLTACAAVVSGHDDALRAMHESDDSRYDPPGELTDSGATGYELNSLARDWHSVREAAGFFLAQLDAQSDPDILYGDAEYLYCEHLLPVAEKLLELANAAAWMAETTDERWHEACNPTTPDGQQKLRIEMHDYGHSIRLAVADSRPLLEERKRALSELERAAAKFRSWLPPVEDRFRDLHGVGGVDRHGIMAGCWMRWVSIWAAAQASDLSNRTFFGGIGDSKATPLDETAMDGIRERLSIEHSTVVKAIVDESPEDDEQPTALKVTLRDMERITLGRTKLATLQKGAKPTPIEQRGQTDVFLYSDWLAIWPENRQPLPDVNEARQRMLG